MQKTRKPIVAGQFYESDRTALNEQIRKSFLAELGPRDLPKKSSDNQITAIIAPHAGYAFSGACAAHAYKELAESSKPDTILIFGTDHSGSGTCLCDQNFETPLGEMEIDNDFLFHLQRKGIKINNKAHSREHSIEVQIPFLRFIYSTDPPKIVPLIVGHDWKLFELEISQIIRSYKDMGKKIVIIVSSDFTHYGMSYGYLPFNKDVKENLAKLDKGATDKIINLDAAGFISYIKEFKPTICGVYGIALLLTILENFNLKKEQELLKYYTSGDVTGDYSSAVGYAGIVFR